MILHNNLLLYPIFDNMLSAETRPYLMYMQGKTNGVSSKFLIVLLLNKYDYKWQNTIKYKRVQMRILQNV